MAEQPRQPVEGFRPFTSWRLLTFATGEFPGEFPGEFIFFLEDTMYEYLKGKYPHLDDATVGELAVIVEEINAQTAANVLDKPRLTKLALRLGQILGRKEALALGQSMVLAHSRASRA